VGALADEYSEEGDVLLDEDLEQDEDEEDDDYDDEGIDEEMKDFIVPDNEAAGEEEDYDPEQEDEDDVEDEDVESYTASVKKQSFKKGRPDGKYARYYTPPVPQSDDEGNDAKDIDDGCGVVGKKGKIYPLRHLYY
jgi:hypothetical protein